MILQAADRVVERAGLQEYGARLATVRAMRAEFIKRNKIVMDQ